MAKWTDEIKERLAGIEKRLSALETDGGVKDNSEIEIGDVIFGFCSVADHPYEISDHSFDEAELKQMIAFWRECGADV